MRIFYTFIFTTTILATIFTSCSKDEEKKGCTDNTALNYNLLAVVDDGSCEYLDTSFTIYENGQLGFLGNPTTGAFEVKSCATGIATILLNPDSLITPPDTIIDNLVSPPDTTITPGDTTITGDKFLLVNSDINGNFNLIIRLLNKQNASDFLNGNLVFSAKLHPDANINNFDVVVHGNHFISGGINCSDYHVSDPISNSIATLDADNFNEISIPLNSFTNRQVQNIDLVFGIIGRNAAPNTSLIIIDNIRWEVKKPD